MKHAFCNREPTARQPPPWPVWPLLGLLLAAGCGRPAPEPAATPGPLRVGAVPVDPIPEGVGRLMPDLAFEDLDRHSGRLSDYSNHTGVVLALRDVDCPVSRQYGQTLARIEAACATQNIAFLYVNSATPNSPESMQDERRRFGFRGRYVPDPTGALGSLLGVHTTAEVFLIDRARTLCYRGAVDDQFGIGYTLPQPRQRFLELALAELLERKVVKIKATSAPGCVLELEPPPPTPATNVTYYHQISRIVQEHCVRCHHPGGVGPFSLMSYEAVAKRRKMIRRVLTTGYMPPWSAEPGSGPWANDPSLSAWEKEQVFAWVDAGAPAGDPREAPVPSEFPGGWSIGQPDVVVELPEARDIPAQGLVPYYNGLISLPFKQDTWVQAIEILPTSVPHVHHALVMVEPDTPPTMSQMLRRRFRKFLPHRLPPGFENYFAVYVPGAYGNRFPPGTAARIPAGSRLRVQMHYVATGVPSVDRTRIGLVLARQPPTDEARMTTVSAIDFVIPAGAPNYRIQAEYEFPQAGKLVSFAPHMHYRGKAYRYDLVDRAGGTTTVLNVPVYDFNWQHSYVLRAPIDIQPGMRLRATSWYDNSTNNPANPDPASDVVYGLDSTNEMMTGCFIWITPVTPPHDT
ncbi:MAG: redoxin domain-containing protein [Lentisphaerae bacterium]|nr:redoxin domain-containing protein [Lentisphaerota bacterium]